MEGDKRERGREIEAEEEEERKREPQKAKRRRPFGGRRRRRRRGLVRRCETTPGKQSLESLRVFTRRFFYILLHYPAISCFIKIVAGNGARNNIYCGEECNIIVKLAKVEVSERACGRARGGGGVGRWKVEGQRGR